LQALKMALVELHKSPHEICLVSGIGQAAKLPHYLACNFFNGLHGRAIPVALGINAVNPRLTTLVVTGEGDCYGEGGNHFLHALRRNPDITIVVHNNEIYALTKGQASPTTRLGEKRSLQPKGVDVPPLNMPAIAIVHNCTFVARGFAGDIDHLKELLVEAIRHPGLSYLDIIQPCITWGTHPLSWYKERVYRLGLEYDPGNRTTALAKTLEGDDGIPLGILYRTTPRKSFGSAFRETRGDSPLAEEKGPGKEKIVELLSRFRSGGQP
jgi:2-oxoglutarate/2-oxoacid ferredoxin oxidoreductase subunit beta